MSHTTEQVIIHQNAERDGVTPCPCKFCVQADEMVDAFTPFHKLGKPRMNDPGYMIAKRRLAILSNEQDMDELSLKIVELRGAFEDQPFHRNGPAQDRLDAAEDELTGLMQAIKILEEEIAQIQSDNGQFGVGV